MQLEVFEKQLSVASSLDRPVSIHCVKAFKELFLVLDRHPCRSVALHSYSGSAHHLRGRDVYVGFSHTLNGSDPKKKDRVDAAIRAVPVDRLLAESDLADPAEACRATHRAVCMIADARGWTPREASEILRENTRRWLRQSPSSLPSFK